MIHTYPEKGEAEALLTWAQRQNPGPWADHCRVAARAAEAIAKACGLDGEKAYILGLLHDIGRFEGVRGLHHAYAGYELMMERGYPLCARICLTHSFPIPELGAFGGGALDCTQEEMDIVASALSAGYDDDDRLIQLCDAISTPQGVCLMDVRLLDVARRHGFNEFTLEKWDAFFALKARFDGFAGRNIYDLFYDEIRLVSFR